MKKELLGFDWEFSGSVGKYYAKNGSARAQEMVIDFGATQFVAMTNCNYGGLSSNPRWIIDAFEAAVK